MVQFLPVEWHNRLPSTNTWLADRVKVHPDTPHGTVVAARAQTAGRGRQQRRWLTSPDQNLTFSFLWNAPVAPAHLPAMAQAIAVGIARFLASEGLTPTIKWPNDVQVAGKKIAGILCETVDAGIPGYRPVVAGIGLNVNMSAEDAAAVDQPATSLALETGEMRDLPDLLDELLDTLAQPLSAWATGGFAAIEAVYTRFTPTPGTVIQVRDGASHVSGRLAGFNSHGALCLTLENGETRVFYSGDVSAPG